MTLICVCSAKGSPGATVSALGLAAAWPVIDGIENVLVEADPSGGSLAIRYRLPTSPGLLSLAARVSAGLDRESVLVSAQRLPDGRSVVLAPDRPDQVVSALRSVGRPLAEALSRSSRILAVMDLGRLGQESTRPLLAVADRVLVVARPRADQLQPAAHLMSTLITPADEAVAAGRAPGVPGRVGWLLVGREPYSPDEVARAYGLPVLGVLPEDPRSAESLVSGGGERRFRRSLLVREFAVLADRLQAALSTNPDQSAQAVLSTNPDQSAQLASGGGPELSPPPPVPPAPAPNTASSSTLPPPPPVAPDRGPGDVGPVRAGPASGSGGR